jgi:hypothetical protein
MLIYSVAMYEKVGGSSRLFDVIIILGWNNSTTPGNA